FLHLEGGHSTRHRIIELPFLLLRGIPNGEVVNQVQCPREGQFSGIYAVFYAPTVEQRPDGILRYPADQEAGFGELPFPISEISALVISTNSMPSIGVTSSSHSPVMRG